MLARIGRSSRLPAVRALSSQRPIVRLAKSLFSGKRLRKVGADYPVEPGEVSAPQPVPSHIRKPHYVDSEAVAPSNDTSVHDSAGVAGMRAAGRVAAEVLDFAAQLVQPGTTTDEIDRMVHAKCMDLGVYPSPLHYKGFPKSVCTSVNEVVCHGALPPPRRSAARMTL